MRNVLRALAVTILVGLVVTQADAKTRKFKEKSDTYPLSDAVTVTEQALDDYQTYALSPEGIKNGLPPLVTADFDFKTVVDNKGGPGISLYIFTLGATKEKQQTNELDFQYQPHVAQQILEEFNINGVQVPKTLYQQLVDTMKESAKEIKKASAQTVDPQSKLDFCQLTLSVSFGVTTDVQGGIKVPIEMVTISATLDHSHNNVQQVKLVFKQTDPKNKSCNVPKPTT